MIPDRLAALRSRISAEPAGPWLDCIVARFCNLPGVFIKDTRRGPMMETESGIIVEFMPSHDHNDCFAALDGLVRKGFLWSAGVRNSEAGGTHNHASVYPKMTRRGASFWYANDVLSLPLAVARAIALAAVDNGVEVEL